MNRWNPFYRLWEMTRERRLPPSLSSAMLDNDPHHLAYLRSLAKDLDNSRNTEIPLSELEVVVVDLETTGFHPQQGDEIIAIGAVAMRGSHVLRDESFSTLVQASRSIPAHIVSLTGITDEALASAPQPSAALTQFFQFVGNRPLVAHHSRHEREFFRTTLWKTSRTRFVHRLLDTMLLIRLSSGPLGNVSLDSLCALHHITIGRRHDAYHDALATASLWGIYLEKAIQQGFRDLQEIYQEIGNQP
ncbi:exonuclease domain-containing protein [Brevibacillus migulae]|uniref:exonuclease domain-containing protein n=1 Tax=Brevibacillus migulae TaxID=1644114 RepID=UPI00106DE25A|nr:exonuclease domain-containing protein [Brevibacillus migulae]